MWAIVRILGFEAFGGMSPTLTKLASSLVNIPGTPMPEYGFYIGVLLYAVLGSGIAFALGEQTIRGAFFAGIAAPALITNAITGAQDVTANTVSHVEWTGHPGCPKGFRGSDHSGRAICS